MQDATLRCHNELRCLVLDDADNIVGRNIRRLRLADNLKQTDLTARLQIYQVAITRESLVKIEGGRQHIKLSQLRGIRNVLGVTYEDILDPESPDEDPKEETTQEEQ